jgi:hypothetical protein
MEERTGLKGRREKDSGIKRILLVGGDRTGEGQYLARDKGQKANQGEGQD